MENQKPENIDAILRRVNKLLAIADGNANENEAAAAATMIAKIMQKYRIENSDLYLAKFKDENEFEIQDTGSYTRLFKWVNYLSASVSLLFGVRTCINRRYIKGKKVKVITFSGFKEDVQVALWTFEYLSSVIKSASQKFHAEHPLIGLSGTDSFRQGMSITIQKRIKEHIESQKNDESVTGRELIVAKDAAVTSKFGDTKFKSAATKITNDQAAYAGMKEGEKVDIFRRGISADQRESQLRLGN